MNKPAIKWNRLLWVGLMLMVALLISVPALTQDSTTATPVPNIEFSGQISEVTETTIVVNGLTVLIDNLNTDVSLVIGAIVDVEGVLLSDGQVQATDIDDTDDDDDNIPPTSVPTNTPIPLEITGEITAVGDGTITVSGLTIALDDLDDDLTISVGTVVTVIGDFGDDNIFIAYTIQSLQAEATPEVTATEVPSEITPEVTAESSPEVTPETTPETTAEPDDDTDDDDVVIVIEGPVTAINVNIVVIYGFEIEVDEDDLALTFIQIGDVLRIEGVIDDDDDDDDRTTIQITAINITFISVTVVIIDGQVWRDSGNCGGVPEWVPEAEITIYLLRCTGGGNPAPPPSSGGGGNNNDDDDDDGGRNRGNRGGGDDDDD